MCLSSDQPNLKGTGHLVFVVLVGDNTPSPGRTTLECRQMGLGLPLLPTYLIDTKVKGVFLVSLLQLRSYIPNGGG